MLLEKGLLDTSVMESPEVLVGGDGEKWGGGEEET